MGKLCVLSHPMKHFQWDSQGNPIPMDKPVDDRLIFTSTFIRPKAAQSLKLTKTHTKKGVNNVE